MGRVLVRWEPTVEPRQSPLAVALGTLVPGPAARAELSRRSELKQGALAPMRPRQALADQGEVPQTPERQPLARA